MATSKRRGTLHHSPRVGWDSVCDDVKLLVLSKLTLQELALVADTCRDFRTACHIRLKQEQAGPIAVAEESFGTNLFQALVPALQRSMFGHYPCPSLLYAHCVCRNRKRMCPEDYDNGVCTCPADYDMANILFDNAGKPRLVRWREAWSLTSFDGPCAVIWDRNATLFPGHLPGPPQKRDPTFISLCGVGSGDEKYVVHMHEEVLGAIIGLLVAVFRQNPEAQLTSRPSPLPVEFRIRGWYGKQADWFADWEGQLDPLRHLAKSITVCWD